jgi:uncharacterized delta-60 repeat protein/RHS repeat-associated protein
MAIEAVCEQLLGMLSPQRRQEIAQASESQPLMHSVFEALESRTLLSGMSPDAITYQGDLLNANNESTHHNSSKLPNTPNDFCECIPVTPGSATLDDEMIDGTGNNPAANGKSENPVRYVDGRPEITSIDIGSAGFGRALSHARSWSEPVGNSINGNGWFINELPQLLERGNGTDDYALVTSATEVRLFHKSGSNFIPQSFIADTLTYDSTNYRYVFTTTTGQQIRFHDFTTTWPADQRGQVERIIDANGNEIVPSYSSGVLQDLSRSGAESGTLWKESFLYEYFNSPNANAGKIKSVSLRRKQWTYTTAASGTADSSANTTLTDAERTESSDVFAGKLIVIISGTGKGQVRTISSFNPSTDTITISAGWNTNPNTTSTYEIVNSTEPDWTIVRRVDYGYYRDYTGDGGTADEFGADGDLRTAAVSDPSTEITFTGTNNLSRSSNIVTATLSNHGYRNGDTIVIRGATDDSFNGTFVISTVQTNSFQYYAKGDNATTTGGTANRPFDVSYYRYYTAASYTNGYAGGLKYVFNARSYARLQSAVTDAMTASNSTVEIYADNYFQYDSLHRVTQEVVQGEGCSCASNGGRGTFNFTYEYNPNAEEWSSGLHMNRWFLKVTEKLPDETSETDTDNDRWIVYLNKSGNVLLRVFQLADDASYTGPRWGWHTRYDASGRILDQAQPSAMAFPSSLSTLEGYDTILDNETDDSNGDLYYLNDNTGLIESIVYAISTTASTSMAGDASGYPKQIWLKRGEMATTTNNQKVKLSSRDYIARQPVENGQIIYILNSETNYRDLAGNEGETTGYGYTWSGFQPIEIDVSRTVTEAQNGPGTAFVDKIVFDSFGQPIWRKDGDGFITRLKYDLGTGAINQLIQDVDTSQTSDEPSGWSTPSGGGLHLITAYVVDGLGRTKQVTDPNGNITYTIFNDANHEVRVYRGWQTNNTTTGPIEITREYRPLANASSGERAIYYEYLTSSATPSQSGGTPTGTETLSASNIQSLRRDLTNESGQIIQSDAYFSISGFTYATANFNITSATASNDTASGNEHSAFYAYDERGRVKRIELPTGTIERLIYDALGHLTSDWIGTDDTPASGFWSPSNRTDTNVRKIHEYEYDAGGAGDGNLTKQTDYPQPDSTPDNHRETDYFYDWRNRAVAQKQGVEGSESTSINRPIIYTAYDNLDRITAVTQYDGDTVSITSTYGTPDAPSESLLRAKTTIDHDIQGRVYAEHVFSVSNSGSVSSNSVNTFYWYDGRSNVIKTIQPGGGVHKYVYDGAGRMTLMYVSDGGGDPAPGATSNWASADDVNGDLVLEQEEYAYDSNSNLTQTSRRLRFHDDYTTTGALGNPGSGSGTAKARVYYTTNYYDAANRLTVAVDLGTNGGFSYSRPSIAPARTTVTGTSSTTGTSDTLVDSSRTESQDFFLGYTLKITGGTGSGQVRTVTGYNASTKTFTVSPAFTTAPNSTSTYSLTPNALVTSYNYDAAENSQSTTDPRALVTKTFYDGLDRVKKVVENYTGSSPSGDADRTTEYTYDGSDHILTQKATLPSSTFQITQYVYGVTTSSSDIASNDLLATIKYPDKSSGNPSTSASDQVSFTYNGLGQTKSKTDQNNNIHTYGYDIVGRLISDSVGSGTLNGGVDASIRTIGYTFDTAGRLWQITSYSDAAATTEVNQVQREYNGLGQLVKEYQAHSGEVNTQSTPNVQYSYSEMASGANHSRLTSMTYPSGKVIRYSYSGAVGLNDSISRLYAVQEEFATGATANLERYQYLGLDIVIKRDRPQNNIDLRYTKNTGEADGEAGDKYTGLDRFGRIADQRWQDPAETVYDRYQYGYDRNGNVLYKKNLVSSSNSELYHVNGASAGYDGLNRLTTFRRGTLTDADSDGVWDTVTTATRSQGQILDQMGNWTSVLENGAPPPISRTHNKQNQLTAIASVNFTFDNNGNMTNDGQNYVYDAWNRLKIVKNSSQTVLTEYSYDAAGRRIISSLDTLSDLYYSDEWQVIEERAGSTPKIRNIWSPVYVDAMIMRERDNDASSDGTLDSGFGSSGTVVTSISEPGLAGRRVMRGFGGKIYAAGTSSGDFALTRYNEDGSLDTAFGSSGVVTTSFGGTDVAYGMAIQEDGKVILVGSSSGSFAIARYNTDGTLDNSFDSDGKVTTTGLGDAYGVAIQADGKIVVAGWVGSDFSVARYNSDGSLDTSFDGDGKLTTNIGTSHDEAYDVAIQSDGKIVVAGKKGLSGSFALARYNTDGSLDTSFDSDGIVTTSGTGDGYSLAIQPDGKILLAGEFDGGGVIDFVIARYNTNGSLDTSFDADGKVTTDFGGSEGAYSITLQNDGKIVAAGYKGTTHFALARYNSNGSLDTSFDTDGKLTTQIGTSSYALSVMIQPDGKIVAAGYSDGYAALARYEVTGEMEERLYVLNDANYNVTALASANGAVVERYLYDPYGARTILTPTWGSRSSSSFAWVYGHQGGRLDGFSGLYHFRNRDLSPTLGRWMQKDPLGYVDGMNSYQYVHSNPAAHLDPSGLRDVWEAVGGGTTQPVNSQPPATQPVNPSRPSSPQVLCSMFGKWPDWWKFPKDPFSGTGGPDDLIYPPGSKPPFPIGEEPITGKVPGPWPPPVKELPPVTKPPVTTPPIKIDPKPIVGGGIIVIIDTWGPPVAIGVGIGALIYYSGAGEYIGTTQCGKWIGNKVYDVVNPPPPPAPPIEGTPWQRVFGPVGGGGGMR